ncbi:hypothetical protein RDI58_003066 [Solanum bulbocastanum]|uniref:catalase n=1 Tax=Solanum bulbocastanum TaxID=147425 RepID=A0AAN8UH57_SOLBU
MEAQFSTLLNVVYRTQGPVLLEDYHLVEKLANFDRERITEHVVHARGSSGKGIFEVTHDIAHLTCADFLRAPGVQTPVIVKFSTVIHERFSPETLRDPCGISVQLYTRDGSYVLVITDRECVGSYFRHPIFKVSSMKFFPCDQSLKSSTAEQKTWKLSFRLCLMS